MGRRKDPPALQKAKGNPGRRAKKVEAELIALAAGPVISPEEHLLASLDVEGLRPPARFALKSFEEELEIWKQIVPRLKQTSRASAEFQAPLAAYCDSVARYNKAVKTLQRQGLTQEVETVQGGKMLRLNPAERVRDKALTEILALSSRFGFTPADNFALLIDQRRVMDGGLQGSLFGNRNASAPANPDQPVMPVEQQLGAMDSFDSAPPEGRPN